MEHAVCYTDGGCRPNPGIGGSGVHGYIYENVEGKEPKKIVVSEHVITNHGYVSIHEELKHRHIVAPKRYIDIVRTAGDHTTNNRAELLAIISALSTLLKESLKSIRIYTDSDYSVKLTEEYRKNRSASAITTNRDLYDELGFLIDAHLKNDTSIKFRWIKGHNDHLGNTLADHLATIGVLSGADNAGTHDVAYTSGNKYWTTTGEPNPLLSLSKCFFNSQTKFNTVGKYYMADPGPSDILIGKRIAETAMSVVKLHEPDSLIEDIRTCQEAVSGDYSNIVMLSMDKVYSSTNYAYLDRYRKYAMSRNKRLSGLNHIKGDNITSVINPVGLSLKAIEAFDVLEEMLDNYIAEEHKNTQLIDITDLLYEEVPKKTSTTLELKAEIGVGYSQLTVRVPLATSKTKEVNVPIVLGVDLPIRNKLKKLEKYNPVVKLVLWSKTENSFRYCCIIQCTLGVSICSNYYADRLFHL